MERVRYVPDLGGYFIVPSENGDKMLSKILISEMTQEEAAGYRSRNGFHAASMPEYFEIFGDLYAARNNGGDVEDARKFVQVQMREQPLLTLTRATYHPGERDLIIHGYGREDEKIIPVSFSGESGNIEKVLLPEQCLALTGKKPGELHEIIEYLNGTGCFIYRSNLIERAEERVARFVAYSGRVFLDCKWKPSSTDSSLGVRLTKRAGE